MPGLEPTEVCLFKCPLEILDIITCNLEQRDIFNLQTSCTTINECLRLVERNQEVYFDGSKSSICNIFHRCNSIGLIKLETRNLDFFHQVFGTDHGFKIVCV